MAIAYDTTTTSAYSPATSVTWSHTCTGSDRILFVAAYVGTSNTTTATYNGVSMTAINSLAMTGAAAGQFIKLFYLVAPASGANNCVVSVTAGDLYGFASSFTGAAQTGQPDSNNTGESSSTASLSVSTTTVADNSWLVGISYTGNTPSAGANTTIRGGTTVLKMIDSNSAQTPAGSYSLTVTQTASFAGIAMASFSPAGGGGATYRRKALLGVGQ